MGAQMRVYRQRIRSVQATKKITRAMELIAASRVVKAQQRVKESSPYARAITRAVSAVATYSDVDHPLTTEHDNVRRAAVLIVTSDRGLAGAYSSSVIKESERLIGELRDEGKEVVPYLVGRKAVGFYKFRKRDFAAEWSGFTDQPTFEVAREIAERVVAGLHQGLRRGRRRRVPHRLHPLRQHGDPGARGHPHAAPRGRRGRGGPGPTRTCCRSTSSSRAPRRCSTRCCRSTSRSRIYNCLLQAAASELASRQRAMKSATDNAEELIKKYTRLANQARQAEITQEISEIVGGASALADAK